MCGVLQFGRVTTPSSRPDPYLRLTTGKMVLEENGRYIGEERTPMCLFSKKETMIDATCNAVAIHLMNSVRHHRRMLTLLRDSEICIQ